MTTRAKHDFEKAAEIIRDAGGCIVGRTRLQKIGSLLKLTGLEDGFEFSYKHFGPYSETLATATRDAKILGLLEETEQQASWGGLYSTFTTNNLQPDDSVPPARKEIAEKAAGADSIALELAVTAAFLSSQGVEDAWIETERRKPEKAAGGKLNRAKKLYAAFKRIETPKALPDI